MDSIDALSAALDHSGRDAIAKRKEDWQSQCELGNHLEDLSGVQMCGDQNDKEGCGDRLYTKLNDASPIRLCCQLDVHLMLHLSQLYLREISRTYVTYDDDRGQYDD